MRLISITLKYCMYHIYSTYIYKYILWWLLSLTSMTSRISIISAKPTISIIWSASTTLWSYVLYLPHELSEIRVICTISLASMTNLEAFYDIYLRLCSCTALINQFLQAFCLRNDRWQQQKRLSPSDSHGKVPVHWPRWSPRPPQECLVACWRSRDFGLQLVDCFAPGSRWGPLAEGKQSCRTFFGTSCSIDTFLGTSGWQCPTLMEIHNDSPWNSFQKQVEIWDSKGQQVTKWSQRCFCYQP